VSERSPAKDPNSSESRCESTVNSLMSSFRVGDKQAANQLVDLLYPDLLRLAQSYMNRERSGHLWQPEVLVNELYVELMNVKHLPPRDRGSRNERSAFLGLASHLMRRLLIHHSRPLAHRVEKVELADACYLEAPDPETLGEVQKMLLRLERIDPRFRAVVEMRVFEGVSREEIARRMGCAPRTVARCWESARSLLQDQMGHRAMRSTALTRNRPRAMLRPHSGATGYVPVTAG
jgi:RNA polymerase sigma factor (TIGR02999 family)